jgi:hypothetical protein
MCPILRLFEEIEGGRSDGQVQNARAYTTWTRLHLTMASPSFNLSFITFTC